MPAVRRLSRRIDPTPFASTGLIAVDLLFVLVIGTLGIWAAIAEGVAAGLLRRPPAEVVVLRPSRRPARRRGRPADIVPLFRS